MSMGRFRSAVFENALRASSWEAPFLSCSRHALPPSESASSPPDVAANVAAFPIAPGSAPAPGCSYSLHHRRRCSKPPSRVTSVVFVQTPYHVLVQLLALLVLSRFDVCNARFFARTLGDHPAGGDSRGMLCPQPGDAHPDPLLAGDDAPGDGKVVREHRNGRAENAFPRFLIRGIM